MELLAFNIETPPDEAMAGGLTGKPYQRRLHSSHRIRTNSYLAYYLPAKVVLMWAEECITLVFYSSPP